MQHRWVRYRRVVITLILMMPLTYAAFGGNPTEYVVGDPAPRGPVAAVLGPITMGPGKMLRLSFFRAIQDPKQDKHPVVVSFIFLDAKGEKLAQNNHISLRPNRTEVVEFSGNKKNDAPGVVTVMVWPNQSFAEARVASSLQLLNARGETEAYQVLEKIDLPNTMKGVN